ncbi:SDR family oxidoreductase [Streptomyces sp. MI02-2A]|uniref:SDR family oxidoreductase n=1 Tax=unclassified Streptomyces TaxID=2593676 RepID=UPI000740E355|nr:MULTISPECIES: SDR family oxidoreductase [unclassified Streptomyces]KUJ54113.1 3-ketoacyl-ACP reductase [Streptomyces sp. NRRL F-5122]MDX3261804.1 SDR family oxidoreductase [Streptomyces sp. MI02-2A]REE59285.1 3-oxoacyl-[acyl-carrier protein] reductase [Streptomyces sp. 3212.3]
MPRLPSPTVEELRRDPLPLRGRTALVTGAGRRGGIGYAVARRLAAYGAGVYLHHHVPHDAAMPWGADRPEEVVAAVRAALGDPDAPVVDGPADLSDPSAPAELIATAAGALGGRLDILVANHALSGSDGTLDTVDAAMLDAHWAVDTRSVLFLVQAYARLRAATPAGGAGGRVVMMTSGQDIAGGMPEEIAYALQKGALASITRSLATALAERGVTVNTVNPGPVDTDYLTGDAYETVAARFPAGHWGMPDDPARLIAWLATDEAAWITGQVIDSEGGFRR